MEMEEQLIDAVEKTFSITPTTIYGVLAGLLLIAVIFLARYVVSLNKKVLELAVSQVDSSKDIISIIERFQESEKFGSDSQLKALENVKVHICEKIDSLEKRFLNSRNQ